MLAVSARDAVLVSVAKVLVTRLAAPAYRSRLHILIDSDIPRGSCISQPRPSKSIDLVQPRNLDIGDELLFATEESCSVSRIPLRSHVKRGYTYRGKVYPFGELD